MSHVCHKSFGLLASSGSRLVATFDDLTDTTRGKGKQYNYITIL